MGQAQSVQIPKRWPLVNNVNNRDGLFLKDARLVNCYAEKDVTTGEYEINKRPGKGPQILIPSPGGLGQGVFSWEVFKPSGSFPLGLVYNITYVVAGQLFNFSQVSGLQTNPGNVTAIQGKVYFQQVPNQTTPRIFMVGQSAINTAAMYYMGLDLVIHPVGSGGNAVFNTVAGVAYLDGTLYVMDIYGTIWNTTNPNDPTLWDPLGFINAISEGDYGVYLAKQLVYIVAIKQFSTLFFYDAGNSPGSPLAPVPGAILNIGCLSADTVQNMDGVLIWVSRSKDQPSQVVLVHNLQPEVISVPSIERMLDLSLGNQFYSLVFKRGGHKFYMLTNVTKNVSMVFDLGEKLWYLWTDPLGNYFPAMSQTVDPLGRWLLQNDTTGSIDQADSDYIYPNDQGVLIPVDIYTPNFDAGINRWKQLNQMFFNADQTDGSVLQVRSSDDDYQTWSNYRSVNLSEKRPGLTAEGSFLRRAYNFHHQCNTKLRIRSADLQMDIGTL
jgi:hypothetical protein